MSNYPTNMDDNETHDVLDEVENDLADEIALDVSMDQHEIEDINVESYICTSPTKQTNDDSVRRKAVKKPLTAFIFYMSEKREKLMKENPHLKFGEIGKMVGETYKLLAPEERERYDNLAKQDRERYIREFEEFKIYSASHPEEFTVINKVSDSTLTIPLVRNKSHNNPSYQHLNVIYNIYTFIV